MRDLDQLTENLREIIDVVKINIYKYEDDFIKDHREMYQTGTAEQKQFLIDLLKDREKETKKQIKKIDQAYELLKENLY